MPAEDLEEQIEKLVQRFLYEADSVQRGIAANGLFNRFTAAGLHPTDIKIRLNGAKGQFPLLDQMRHRINQQDNEIQFLRGHVPPEILQWASKAGNIAWRWPELKELIRTRITGDSPESDTLTGGWRRRLSELSGLHASVFTDFELGKKQIPDSLIDRLRELPLVPEVTSKTASADQDGSSKRERQKRKRSDGFPWTPETYQECLRIRRERGDKGVILRFLGITTNAFGPVDRKLTNDPPDELLLQHEIQILDGDVPMDFLEFWKIGHALWSANTTQGTWKGYMAKRFEKHRDAILWDDPIWLTSSQREELRCEYREVRKRRQPTAFDIDSLYHLWPSSVAVVAARQFAGANLPGKDVNRLSPRDVERLKDRLSRELQYREESQRYLHLSRGLALLPKRRVRQSKSARRSDMSGDDLRAFAVKLFGRPEPSNRLERYLAQLLGFDHTLIRDIFNGGRSRTVMEAWEPLLETVGRLVDGIDLDDPASERELMQRVRSEIEAPSVPS